MNSLATVVIPQDNIEADDQADKTKKLLSKVELLNKGILGTIKDVKECKKECKETVKIIKEFNAPFRENC